MKLFLYRIVVVSVIGIAVLLLCSGILSRDEEGKNRFEMNCVVEADQSASWSFTVTDAGLSRFNNRQADFSSVENAISVLVNSGAKATLAARNIEDASVGSVASVWKASLDGSAIKIDGADSDLASLFRKLRNDALPKSFVPTRAVTVKDVLAANPAMPTRSKVSFPSFSFEQAFPGDSYQQIFPEDVGDNEHFNITSFQQAPLLDGSYPVPDKWKKFMPDLATLPPVEQRLPQNPAVIVGPDSPGRYSPGRPWRRSADATTDWNRKLGAESFAKFDSAGRLQPCIAYRWEVEDNNRVYTFYLRKGHKWSNGMSFTAQDIEFVCNTIIGSSYWATSPGWMMETDGFTLLYSQDILNWPALRKAMLDTENSGLARIVDKLGTDELKAALAELPQDKQPDRFMAESVVNQVNTLLRSREFFDPELFGKLDLESDLAELRDEIGYSRLDRLDRLRMYFLMERNDLLVRASKDISALKASEVTKLNILMFRASLRGVVAKAERKRVKIEAVDDGTGDNTHIVRFTFPRPNSIFLEKTGTFMFYRGIFEMPRAYYNKFIPMGVDEIDVRDIYDWDAFVAAILSDVDAAGGENENPSKRLWAAFDETTRQMLRNDPPAEMSAPEKKQALVDAINAALVRRDYFDQQAWSGVDMQIRWNAHTAGGFSTVNTRTVRTEVNEILEQRDLLKRFTADSTQLTDVEILRLNMMMFREAYGPGAGRDGLIAVNREAALDRAAQLHPKVYSTWVIRAQRLVDQTTGYEDHVPTLRAWIPISKKAEPQFNILRNPYYYKVDQDGRQLPYIDIIESKKEPEEANVQLTMSSGNVDFQARGITFDHYTFLKSREKYGNYRVLLWANDYVGELVFYLSQVHKDKRLERLYTDRNFRHALSMGINRQEIIDIVFHGLSEPAQYSIPEGSPYYSEKLAKSYVQYDPDQANKLLDELGLDKRDASGMRLLPDGQPLALNMDTTDWLPIPGMMLVCEHWRKIGLNVSLKIRSASLITRMIDMGLLDIGTMKEGGNYIGPMAVGPMVPVHQAESRQWSEWVKYMATRGRSGLAPPEWLLRVNRMWNDVVEATNDEEKFSAWQRLADWTAEDLPVFGVTTSPGKLIYVKNDFKNVPDLAMAGWIAHEPANCCPEGFYFSENPDGK